MDSQKTQSGFSLIELMMAITMGGIIMALGVSSYKYVTNANRVSGEINALLGDMQFARYEAVKEGLTVKICPVTATTSPLPTACTASATWSNGWIVLSNAVATSGTSLVLRRQLPFTSSSSSDTLTNNAGTAAISFNREGYAVGISSPSDMFSLHDPSSITSYTRCLMVGTSGVLSTAQYNATVLGQTCT